MKARRSLSFDRPCGVLIVGATSAIGERLARLLAARGWFLVISGRSQEQLERIAADLRVRGAGSVHPLILDASDRPATDRCIDRAVGMLPGGLDGVIVCHGSFPDEKDRLLTAAETRDVVEVNFTSAAVVLTAAAAYLQQRRSGFLAAISSVAGERGRQSNFTYGASKAALTALLSGLRNRLHPFGIPVLTIEPGFVDTPMTRGLDLPRFPSIASPERVAADIERAILRGADRIYTPWFWRWIMLGIRWIPESVFKRLRL